MLINREEYIAKNMEQNIKDMTCNGNCSRCGSCCGLFIPFTEKELDEIKQYVKKHNIQPNDNRYNKLTGQFNAQCCFYDDKEKKCTIYPVRPYVCRDFICSRKNWKQYRDKYELRAKYNSSLSKQTVMGTFDDLIYNETYPILSYIFSILPVTDNGVDDRILIDFFKSINRTDLLKYFDAYNENGEKINGQDLLK